MPAKAKLNNELIAAELVTVSGNIMAVAKKFGVSRQSILERIHKSPALTRICKDAREGMKDHAESALYRAIIGGEAWAICFFLKTQGKDRGYIERQELTGADGEPVTMRFVEEIVVASSHAENQTALNPAEIPSV